MASKSTTPPDLDPDDLLAALAAALADIERGGGVSNDVAAVEVSPMSRPPSKRAQRDARTLELRRAGATFDQIARQVGWSNRGQAKKSYDRALEATGGPETDRVQARVEEVDRLDRLLTAVWPKAMKGELDAVREARQITRLRVHLLGLAIAPTPILASADGDDEDTELPVTGTDGGQVIPPSRLEQRRRELDDARRGAPSTTD